MAPSVFALTDPHALSQEVRHPPYSKSFSQAPFLMPNRHD